jgi:hypothetical protein
VCVCSKRKEKNSTSWVLLFLFPLFVLLVSRGLQFLLSHLGFFVGLGLGSLVVALLCNCVHNPFYLTLSFLFFFFFFFFGEILLTPTVHPSLLQYCLSKLKVWELLQKKQQH